jgi:hypothetical protein
MGGDWSTLYPGRFTPGKGTRYPFCRGWVGPRASLDGCGKFHHRQDSMPRPSSPEQVAIPTELSRPTYITERFIWGPVMTARQLPNTFPWIAMYIRQRWTSRRWNSQPGSLKVCRVHASRALSCYSMLSVPGQQRLRSRARLPHRIRAQSGLSRNPLAGLKDHSKFRGAH